MNKNCTSIEQSKKLAEILPLESADMWYWEWPTAPSFNNYKHPMFHQGEDIRNIPCWSLMALINVLPSVITREGKRMFLTLEKAGTYNLYYKSPDRLDELWETKEDVVDACYEMILKLHELKLL